LDLARGPDRDASGAIVDERSILVTKLRAGDCITDVAADSGSYADVASCTAPHNGEVTAWFALPAGQWPGKSEVQKIAEDACDKRFTEYAGAQPENSFLQVVVPPEQDDWSRTRNVTCIAYHPGGTTTGSLRR
jgi:23S rRNA U2552 (ribose-2'-O)-methylase RlmE/FtsJ